MRNRSIETDTYRYTHYGNADVLHAHRHPLDAPGFGQVAVEVIAAGVNHMDAFLRNGRESTWHDDPWPRGSGSDFAGIVTATGPGAERFRVGDDVIGHVRTGAHATHLVVDAANLVHKPAGLPWETAGGLYLAGATALRVLDDLRIGADDTVVISAAAGGVGSIQAQIARYRGAHVIGTCGDRNFDYLRQLGIRPVRYGEGIEDRIRRAAEGRRVTAFIDNFGKDGSDIARDLGVAPGRYRSSEDRRDVELDLLKDDPESVARGTATLAQVADLAAAGAFRLLVSGLYPFADIIYAFDDLEKLHARGKIVLATHPVTPYRVMRAREIHEAMA